MPALEKAGYVDAVELIGERAAVYEYDAHYPRAESLALAVWQIMGPDSDGMFRDYRVPLGATILLLVATAVGV